MKECIKLEEENIGEHFFYLGMGSKFLVRFPKPYNISGKIIGFFSSKKLYLKICDLAKLVTACIIDKISIFEYI